LAEEEGAELAEVAAAFVVVERLFDLKTLWQSLDAQPMPEGARLFLFDRLAGAVGNLMSDVLRSAAGRVDAAHLIEDLRPGVEELTQARGELISEEARDRAGALHRTMLEKGAPDAMAAKVAHLFDFDGAIGLAKLALSSGVAPIRVTQAFTDIGVRLGLDWAQGTAAYMSPSDIWERLLVSGLARDFQQMRLDFLRRLMADQRAREHPLDAVAEWAARNEAGVAQFRKVIARAQAHQPIAPAVLAQVASQARNLLER
ncbi:MAG: NAD-glutamate dehydrogenase, partial [Erythrobacter sp.]|nr:NAD-glutamate dehydrogenase [Erythrobacter sp.]